MAEEKLLTPTDVAERLQLQERTVTRWSRTGWEFTSAQARYVAIYAYAAELNMVGRVERTRQLYGRLDPHSPTRRQK